MGRRRSVECGRIKKVEGTGMRVKKAFEILKGYCNKQDKCETCRFYNKDMECELRNHVPCDWNMPKKGGVNHE